jgi:small subunit ribosomal protein S4
MRYVYGITEKQLRRYVDSALASTSHQPVASLTTRLEERLDNVVYRLGLAKTRRFARQMVSHGHITLGGKRMNIPSHKVKVGDVISVREGSKQSPMYLNFAEIFVHTTVPAWLTMDPKKLEGTVTGVPAYNAAETLFDPEQVFEFYSR